ncbi:hypothetical protein SAMN05414137_120197 [Streptacidiphilus jiangxiensis]|uniref:Uncharacterized protein n=2 Tax=Streptacidiphilus jiangxiensis TaxID=235985 RepID=A0A1H7WIT3_STRJI|nr:hypothetical protein SAMN05414137_120197 [Streptacidiphilus jiangxiensis]
MISLAALLTTDGERLEEIKRLWREATALKREAAAEVRASVILDKARRAAKEETRVILQAAREEAAKLRDEAIKNAVEEAESLLAAGRAAAEQVLEEAREESRRMTEEGRLELDALVDRRKDINTEIARVQDVLTALEAFESRPGAGAMAEDPEAVEKSPATGSPRWGRRKRAQPD